MNATAREIRKHTYESFKGCYGRANQCVHRQDCKLTGVCGDCPAKGAPCVRCSYRNCSRFCDRVEYIDCSQRLLRTVRSAHGAQTCRGGEIVSHAVANAAAVLPLPIGNMRKEKSKPHPRR